MEFQRYTDPWTYFMLPNFLSEAMFDVVEKTAYRILDFETPKHRSMVLDHKHDQEFTNYFINLYPLFCEKLEIKEVPRKTVRVLFQYVCYKDCEDKNFVGTGIHNDSFAKQFSCLIPISETGSGTLLYDENLRFVKEVDWKKNCAFVFANKPNHFHEIGSSLKTTRCLLNVLYMPVGYTEIHEKTFNVKRAVHQVKHGQKLF